MIEAIQLFLYWAVADQTIPFKNGENGDSLSIAVSGLPEAGRIDPKNGLYVLPKDWNNSEDDVYERLV